MRHPIRPCLAAALLLACGHAAAAGVQLVSPVPYAQNNRVTEAIKTECELGEQLAASVKAHASVPVELVAQAPGAGRVLQLEIVDAVSMDNGFLKYTRIKGTLLEGGQKVAGFKGRRNSMGGAFGRFGGTCSILGRTVEALGQDIGLWLDAPIDGAHIGG